MANKTVLSNMALSNLGTAKEIADLDTDKSEEANACRRYFDFALKSTLSDLYWTFATRYATLNLITSNPNDEWSYSYRYPSDCLDFRRILSGERNDTQSTRIPYKIGSDDVGLIIYTDKENAECEYTANISNTALFPNEFDLAFSFRLSTYIAPRVTDGDPFKLRDDMQAQYVVELGNAKKKNMNEEVSDPKPQADSVRARR